MEDDNRNEDMRRHLDYVENIIARMNQNSFKIKGWMITLVTALLALASKIDCKGYVFIAVIPVLLFWILDAYYLQQERKFKHLYNDIVVGKIPVYKMEIGSYKDEDSKFLSCLIAKSVWPLYMAMIILLEIIWLVLQ